MANARATTWRRLGLEFAVVVIGILAALGVDDWRQFRTDRQLEQHLLSSLLEDLRIDEQDAEIQVLRVSESLEAAAILLSALEHPLAPRIPDAPRSYSPEDLDDALQRLSFLSELEVADGTYSEMIATASFRVIRDPTLRRAISAYYASAEIVLGIPMRRVDPRPEFLSALAAVGVVPGYGRRQPDLLARLRSNPAIGTHALRLHAQREATFPSVEQERMELIAAILGALQ